MPCGKICLNSSISCAKVGGVFTECTVLRHVSCHGADGQSPYQEVNGVKHVLC